MIHEALVGRNPPRDCLYALFRNPYTAFLPGLAVIAGYTVGQVFNRSLLGEVIFPFRWSSLSLLAFHPCGVREKVVILLISADA